MCFWKFDMNTYLYMNMNPEGKESLRSRAALVKGAPEYVMKSCDRFSSGECIKRAALVQSNHRFDLTFVFTLLTFTMESGDFDAAKLMELASAQGGMSHGQKRVICLVQKAQD